MTAETAANVPNAPEKNNTHWVTALIYNRLLNHPTANSHMNCLYFFHTFIKSDGSTYQIVEWGLDDVDFLIPEGGKGGFQDLHQHCQTSLILD